MELSNIDEALKKTNALIRFAREKKYKIYFIQHFSVRDDAAFFVKDSEGVKLYKELNIQNEMVIKKNYPNSFKDTTLKKELEKENVKSLLICGAMTHMCIDSTVRAGFDLGYEVTLAHDACATRDLYFKDELIKAKDVHNGFLSALGSVFCELKDTNDIIIQT